MNIGLIGYITDKVMQPSDNLCKDFQFQTKREIQNSMTSQSPWRSKTNFSG